MVFHQGMKQLSTEDAPVLWPKKKTHSAERQTLLSILLTGHRRDNLKGS